MGKCTTLGTTSEEITGLAAGLVPPENKYYVSRNVGTSGDGSSWAEAFKTIGEAIAAVNLAYSLAQYPTRGRNTMIIVDEGYYIELPLTLTANDCHIISAAPGTYDKTVLYGSSVAGTPTVTSGGPALTITGSNCTVEEMGFFTHDVLYPALRIGTNAGDPDTPTVSSPTGTKILNCAFTKEPEDGQIGGILDYDIAGSLIDGCTFSTSCKDYGIKIASNGVVNPIDNIVRNCKFTGVPTGILQAAGHNALYHDNRFMDDTSDTADTCDTPIVIDATSGQAWDNWAQGVDAADAVTGTGTISEIRNWGDNS